MVIEAVAAAAIVEAVGNVARTGRAVVVGLLRRHARGVGGVVGAERSIRVDRARHRLEGGASAVDHRVAAHRGHGVRRAVELRAGDGRSRGCGGGQRRESEHSREDARLLVRDDDVEHARVVEDPVHPPRVRKCDAVAGDRIGAGRAARGTRAGTDGQAETER